jgi:hypothetical protein
MGKRRKGRELTRPSFYLVVHFPSVRDKMFSAIKNVK